MAFITGDNADNTLMGTGEDDELWGAGGADLIEGGDGADTLNGDVGRDRLFGGSGNDSLNGGPDDDYLEGGAGDDYLLGQSGFDSVSYIDASGGVTVNLSVLGYQAIGADQGNDQLVSIEFVGGSAFADTLVGSSLNDVLAGNGGDDSLGGGVGFDNLNGGEGNDTLLGEAGTDTLHGGRGDDILDGGVGTTDEASYLTASAGVTVDLAVAGPQVVGADQGVDTLIGIEVLRGSNFGDVLATSAAGGRLFGEGGDDTLIGERFADVIRGGAGNDLIRDAGGINGLFGDDGDDTIQGGSQNDEVFGGAGNDSLNGGASGDVLHGGQGDDVIDGGGGLDSANYASANGSVSVDLSIIGPQAVGADQGTDTLLNIVSIFGSAFGDRLTGDAANNGLTGDGGDDTLVGGSGDDVLNGGVGNDLLIGGAGTDSASYFGLSSGVSVDLALAGPQSVGSNGGIDTLVDIENLSGSAHADTLAGDAGANQLFGQSGDDRLIGAAGDDTLNGGNGADLAVYSGSRADYQVGLDTNGDVLVRDLRPGAPDGLDRLVTMEFLSFTDGQLSLAAALAPTATIGADTLAGTAGPDSIASLAGDDSVTGLGGNDYFDGGAGADTAGYGGVRADYTVTLQSNGFVIVTDLRPGSPDGADTLTGVEFLSFADSRIAAPGAVNLSGTDGNDTLTGTILGDTLSGLAGNDVLDGLNGNDLLLGGDGHDFLRGRAGADTLIAGSGNDFVQGGPGDDVLDGGAGIDRVSYADATGPIVTSLLRQGQPQNGAEILLGFEHISGSPFNDDLTGDDGANWMWGGLNSTGGDTLNGLAGDDLIMVNDGDGYWLFGGAGVDTLSLWGNGLQVTTGISFDLTLQGALQFTGAGHWLARDFENLSGSRQGDTLSGDANANVIAGDLGNDSLAGQAGDDLILGDGAIDMDTGGLGGSGPIVMWTHGRPNFGFVPGADTLQGGDGADTLVGGGGDDLLLGGAGEDRAVFTGARVDYQVSVLPGGQLLVTDLRSGSPDGSDTLADVEILGFSDGDRSPLTNSPPVAVADAASVAEGQSATIDVLANDTDVDVGDGKILVSVSASGSGASVSIVDGKVAYAADAAAFNALPAGQAALDTFSYTVRDLAGAESSATVSVTVTGVNDAPVTAPVTGSAAEGAVTVTLNALANATDADAGAVLSVTGVPATLPLGVTYDAAAQTFRLDPTVSAYEGLRAGQTQVVTVAYSVTDGLASTAQTASWTVTGANDGPVAVADLAQVNEDQTVTIDVLANDTDADVGDAKSIVSVSGTALGGSVSIVGGKVIYAADADRFDLLSAGQSVTDSFSYTIADAAGATSTTSVSVQVSGIANGVTLRGGNGPSTLTGTAGEEVVEGGNGSDQLSGMEGADTLSGGGGSDTLSGGQGIDSLSGGNGNDSLDGGAGADQLSGGNGDDVLVGGEGSDLLSGGNGGDRFVFTGAFGHDVITDFDKGDRVQLEDAQFADFDAVMAKASQVGDAVVITLDASNSLTLAGLKLSSLGAGDFLFT